MKTILLHIVGYEACPVNGGASGFNWYPNKSIADKDYIDTLKACMNSAHEVYRGEIEIEVSDNYKGTPEEREEITERIEAFLEDNEWEKAFKGKEGCFKVVRHKITS